MVDRGGCVRGLRPSREGAAVIAMCLLALGLYGNPALGAIQLSFQCQVTPLQMEVWRSEREVYLDPSTENRAAVSRRLIDRVLVPLRSPDTVVQETEPFLRAKKAIPSLGLFYCVFREEFGDPAMLVPAFDEQVSVYQEQQEQLGKGVAPALSGGLALLEDQATGELHSLQRRLEEQGRPTPKLPDFEELARYCPNLTGYAERARATLEQKKTRLARLDAALAVPLVGEGRCGPEEVDSRSRQWAIQEIIGERDPRKWDPIEFAHLVRAARHFRFPSEETHHISTLDDLFPALNRMGFLRAVELLGPGYPYSSWALPDDVSIDPTKLYWNTGSGFAQHFQHEDAFYLSEWDEQHPLVTRPLIPTGAGRRRRPFSCWILPWTRLAPEPPVHNRPMDDAAAREPERNDPTGWLEANGYVHVTEAQRERKAQAERYARERWLETDQKAPHPDMDAVRAELKKLEALEPSPTKIDKKAPK